MPPKKSKEPEQEPPFDTSSTTDWKHTINMTEDATQKLSDGIHDETFLTDPRRLAVSIRRSYGGMEVLYAIEQVRVPKTELEQQVMFHRLTDEMIAQHTYFVDHVLPKMPKAISNAPKSIDDKFGTTDYALKSGQQSSTPSLQLYQLKLIRREKNKFNKTVYKAVTTSGKYSKYGLTIFPDKLKEYGFWEEFQAEKDTYPYTLLTGIKTIAIDVSGQYANVVWIRESQPDDLFNNDPEDIDIPF